jgi:glycerate 2-kinase
VTFRQTRTGDSPRKRLLELYQAGLDAVDGRESVRSALAGRRYGRCRVVAVGKAAAAMAQGAQDVLAGDIERLLVITKHGHGRALGPGAETIESGHPLPDAASLEAGRKLLEFLGDAPADARLLFLISGGTSALVEVLPEGCGLAELTELNRFLLSGGMAIDAINAVRKRISCIKGGRLARHLGGRNALQLLISDVPGDALDAIGSGMLVPDRSVAPKPGLLPSWVERMMARVEPAPKAADPLFGLIDSELVATNRTARSAIAAAARAGRLNVFDHNELLTESPDTVAQALVSEVQAGEPGVYLWGGETPVSLPPEPGRGGRCQALALELARQIAGREEFFFLCGSTDGTDGPTEDAGALIDGGTVARGEAEGLGADDALARADAGTFLEAAGDLLQTGPTGTNVMDLVIAYKTEDGH